MSADQRRTPIGNDYNKSHILEVNTQFNYGERLRELAGLRFEEIENMKDGSGSVGRFTELDHEDNTVREQRGQ